MAQQSEKFECFTRPHDSIGRQRSSKWRTEPAFSFDGGAERAKAEKVSLTHEQCLKLPTTLFEPGLKNVAYLAPQNSIGAQAQSKHRNEPRFVFGTQSKLDKLTINEDHRLAADNMAKKEARYVQHLEKEAALYYGASPSGEAGATGMLRSRSRSRSPSQHELDMALGSRIDHLPLFMQSVALGNARALRGQASEEDAGVVAVQAALRARTPPGAVPSRPRSAASLRPTSRHGARPQSAVPFQAQAGAAGAAVPARSASCSPRSPGSATATARRAPQPRQALLRDARRAHPARSSRGAARSGGGGGGDGGSRSRSRSHSSAARSSRSRGSSRASASASAMLDTASTIHALGACSEQLAAQLKSATSMLTQSRSQLDGLCRSVSRLELALPPNHAWQGAR